MKQSNLFLTRCLAVLLALALCLGNVSTGLALTVFAADDDKTIVSDAESVAQDNASNSASAYKLAGKLYGNAAAAAILNSGALAGDTVVTYSLPTVEGLTLEGGILTAKTQDAWVPYAYGPAFDNAAANLFDGNTAKWDTKTVFVTYRMNMGASALTQADLQALKAAYDDQKAAMTDLMDWKADMEELSRMKLRVFNSIISGYDFTEEDGNPNDAKNLELRAYFLGLIDNLLTECSGETYLTVVDMLNVYQNNGMVYFFQNSDAIRAEVSKLSANLNGLVGDKEKEDALAQLMDLFNYAHYIDLIADLGDAMNSIASRLSYDNKEILNSNAKNLKAYTAAMESIVAEDIVLAEGELYVEAAPLTITDNSIIVVTIQVTVNGSTVNVPVDGEYNRDVVISEEIVETILETAKTTAAKEIETMVAAVEAEAGIEIEGDVTRFFDVEIDEESLKAMVGENIGKLEMPKMNIQPKKFFIQFASAARSVEEYYVTILDRTIELPRLSEDEVFRFEYYLDGMQIGLDGFYTFSPEELDELFEEQVLVLERVVIDRREEMMNALVNALNMNLGADAAVRNGNTLTISLPSVNAAESLANAFMDANLGYIGLNGERFFYNEIIDGVDCQRMTMQALLNAVLADPEFTNERVIDLAEGKTHELMSASAQLGDDSDSIIVEDLTIVFELETIPSKLVTLGNGLKALKNNFTFETDTITTVDGERNALALSLYAPEKIYEAYLAVLLASYEIDQSNINDINNEIAVEFFYDYIDAVMGSENISMQTFQNTLDIAINTVNHLPKIEIADRDIMHLAKYFDLVNDLYKNITYYPMGDAAGQMLAVTTDEGLKQIMDLLGLDLPIELGTAIVELQPGNETYFWATADLENTSIDFEAMVLDLDAGVAGAKDLYHAYQNGELKEEALNMAKGYGLANAIDFTTNLTKRASELTGQAIIVLMGDTEGDLVINEATILDLNGHTINGNVIAKNGHLLIVDSTMSNNQAGGVNGDVSGHVMIISGSFTDDVTAFLKDGYTQDENGMVKNELFRVEKIGNDLTYYLNSDVMHEKSVNGLLPNMGVVAAEIAIDIALNQYPMTYLAAAGVEVMDVSVENIIGLIVSNDKLHDCAQELLDLINVRGIAHLAKELAKEMVDFEGMAAAIMNDRKMGDVTLTVAPWDVTVEHIYGNGADYLTFGYEYNADEAKTVNVGFAFEGENVKQFVKLLVELKHIFNPERSYLDVDIFRPTFENKVASFGGTVEGRLSFDLTVDYNADGATNAYPAVIAVALAYANEDNRAELVAALNADNDYLRSMALKNAIDNCSVEDVISALKLMNRTTSFNEMAAAIGANVSATEAELEVIWHFVTLCFGELIDVVDNYTVEDVIAVIEAAENSATFDKVIDKIDNRIDIKDAHVKAIWNFVYAVMETVDDVIDTNVADCKLGNLDKDNDGVYVLESTYSADADIYVKGYGLYVNAEKLYEAFEVKVFDIDCLWGDVNHDGFVNAMDATLVLQESVGTREGFFCYAKADVNGDGSINAMDATLILQHSVGTITKFPVEE